MSFSPWEGCLPEMDWCVPCGGGTATYVALLPSAAQSETVITVNQGLRGGKVVELKKTVDQAVKQCPGVKRVLVSMRTDSQLSMTALDVLLEEVRVCPGLLLLPWVVLRCWDQGRMGRVDLEAKRDHCPAAMGAAREPRTFPEGLTGSFLRHLYCRAGNVQPLLISSESNLCSKGFLEGSCAGQKSGCVKIAVS